MDTKGFDTTYQNLPKSYECDNCEAETAAGMHCGHPMHLEKMANGEIKWACWMGAGCGTKDYIACCDNPSLPVHEKIN